MKFLTTEEMNLTDSIKSTTDNNVMPTLLECMNCNHYKGQHDLLCKVKCGFKPTSDVLRHRAIKDGKVDCPMLMFGLNWKNN